MLLNNEGDASGTTGSFWLKIKQERRAFDVKLSLPVAAGKFFAQTYLPGALRDKARGIFFRYLKYRIHRPALVLPIARSLNYTVQAGPFAGIVYPLNIVQADGFFVVPKFLGCYEMECHPFIEQLCSRPYDQVINIGTAEGYYAVGVARRMPGATVIGFETEPQSRKFCAELAEMNGVGQRIELRGYCDRGSLAGILEKDAGREKRTLILCDCEGAELDLLEPATIPSLARADLLIEIHDVLNPAISRAMAERFAPTHRVRRVTSRQRDPNGYPALNHLNPEDRAFLLSEHRKGPMEWFLCTALAA